jgi:putative spermidine/putrescine transport system ATP-binding protein
MSDVVITDLHKRFGEHGVLAGVHLKVPAGSFTALLGPSGAGKTTLLRLLAGFDSPDRGTITIRGRVVAADSTHVSPDRRRIGYVPQEGSLFPHLTVAANVGFGLPRAQRRQAVSDLLELVGLADLDRRYPHQLSGGQQQRVALARALAIEPRVLLLDEPLSALDAKVRQQLREQIRLLQQQLGTTTLFVTHDQEEALSMADRVGVMRQGKLEQIAAPDELYADPATAFVAEFVGVMNRVPGELQSGGTVLVLGTNVPVRGQGPEGVDGNAVDVLVRPEGLKMEVTEHGNGIVTTRTFLGSVTRVGVLISGDVTVQIDKASSEAAALAPGTSVSVSMPPEAVHVASRRAAAS